MIRDEIRGEWVLDVRCDHCSKPVVVVTYMSDSPSLVGTYIHADGYFGCFDGNGHQATVEGRTTRCAPSGLIDVPHDMAVANDWHNAPRAD